jgi:hypothetical protein
MSLTTAPLGGVFVPAATPSHCDRAELDGGSSQKYWCEYSRLTVLPLNHAFV